MEWQPIDTAPKDGTTVLLFEPAQRSKLYGRNSSCRVGVGHVCAGYFIRSQWLSVPGDYGRKPTHWQPLPEPPA